jgi:hypothetical protein
MEDTKIDRNLIHWFGEQAIDDSPIELESYRDGFFVKYTRKSYIFQSGRI